MKCQYALFSQIDFDTKTANGVRFFIEKYNLVEKLGLQRDCSDLQDSDVPSALDQIGYAICKCVCYKH